MPPKQNPIRSMQHVLVDLRYEKAYIFNNLIKYNFCNFTLWMSPYLECPGPSPRSLPPLHATGSNHGYSTTGHFIVHAYRKTGGERFSTGVPCKTSL